MAEEILTRSADPIKVKLIKGQRDTYGWEISVQGDDAVAILDMCQLIDANLRGVFPKELGKERNEG